MIAAIAVAVVLGGAPNGSRAFKAAAIGPEPLLPYVDLGPIIAPSPMPSKRKLIHFLQLEGDRLGADGFFVTAGDPVALYAPVYSGGAFIPSGGGAGDATFAAIIATIAALASKPYSSKNPAVLRAFTFRKLAASTREALLHLAAQVVTGEITVAEFEAERERLLKSDS